MKQADLDLAIEWAAAEGWNPGLEDAACFRAADGTGFLMNVHEGEPVASISVVRYSPSYGFLGLYIVRPEWRGQGCGYHLWQAGMAYLDGCTVGLDGVVAQQENYARSGFVLAHRNVRFGGNPAIQFRCDRRVKTIGPELFKAVLAYDCRFFAAARESFLRCWLNPNGRKAMAFVEDGSVKGYGVVRTCRIGFKIGPLFADSDREAHMLFQALAADAADSPIFLDLPEPNQSAAILAAQYGLSPVFETARMYRGLRPDLPLSQTYGITTFELG